MSDFSFERLATSWRRERQVTRERFQQERRQLDLPQRVRRGLALRGMEVDDADAVAGGRVRLWVKPGDVSHLDDLRVSAGDPVRLWWRDPDEDDAVQAVVARRRGEHLALVVDGDVPDRLWDGGFNLDREAPEHSFDRGDRAIARFREPPRGSPIRSLAPVLAGTRAPRFREPPVLRPFDDALEELQRQAVAHALAAEDVALIHGPPGTGKTRTLVEVVRQAVAMGERVLVTAASNTAVDNLAERLVQAELDVVRLGHPARVSPAMESRSLDALVERTDAYRLAHGWMGEAAELRRTAERRFQRGKLTRRERRGMLQEAGRLMQDARKQLACVQDLVLTRVSVVCATAAGSDAALLGRFDFDRVLVDEATQAPDPLALVALARAPKAVLAGDPCQLPPTVIDRTAAREGLSVTFFERLAGWHPEAVRMLDVQHRMHEALMRFPSASMYGGKLRAADAVAAHRLEDLGVAGDPARKGPLLLVDTAGRGWEEERTEDDPSTRNPGHAGRVEAEARRLVQRGLKPRDIAVITAYEAQARLLREALSDLRAEGLEVGTVDGFQGREKEAVLVDLVRSNDAGEVGFLADIRRMNVALTRARRFLLVVGDSATLGAHAYYADFLRAVEAQQAWQSAWDA